MSAKEIIDIIVKPWCKTTDIAKLVGISNATASRIKSEIERNLKTKGFKRYLPQGMIPTKAVIEYFDIDLEYLKNVIDICKELE